MPGPQTQHKGTVYGDDEKRPKTGTRPAGAPQTAARPPADLAQPSLPGHDSSARQTGATVCACVGRRSCSLLLLLFDHFVPAFSQFIALTIELPFRGFSRALQSAAVWLCVPGPSPRPFRPSAPGHACAERAGRRRRSRSAPRRADAVLVRSQPHGARGRGEHWLQRCSLRRAPHGRRSWTRSHP